MISLAEGWPGWWSKIELFRLGLFSGKRVLYLDLDTVVVGPLDDFAGYRGSRAVLRDFYKPEGMIGSGVMLWSGDSMADVWRAYAANPKAVQDQYPRRMDHFLHPFVQNADRIQDLFPGQAVSYKAHVGSKQPPYGLASIPDGARLVCMHGKPRLVDLPQDNPVRKEWGR